MPWATALHLRLVVTLHPSEEFWFSECFSVSDFAFTDLPLKSETHKDITCYECLDKLHSSNCLGHFIPCADFRSNFAHGVTTLVRNCIQQDVPQLHGHSLHLKVPW